MMLYTVRIGGSFPPCLSVGLLDRFLTAHRPNNALNAGPPDVNVEEDAETVGRTHIAKLRVELLYIKPVFVQSRCSINLSN
jgi:hypothetical protein